MKIIERWNDTTGNMFYTVLLNAEHDAAVTIKVLKHNHMAYTMQNRDGSVVHGYNYVRPLPNYPYDEEAAMKLVAKAYKAKNKSQVHYTIAIRS